MTFTIEKMEASKARLRRKLASLPVAEKLRILDDLRARDLTLKKSSRAIGTASKRRHVGGGGTIPE